ncbi:MAG: TlpA family protein disulfide reductase [Planctomycetaceae bacterium]|nr:TlpA family protein disulfide reductase [Planctomycetaceae bacterium]
MTRDQLMLLSILFLLILMQGCGESPQTEELSNVDESVSADQSPEGQDDLPEWATSENAGDTEEIEPSKPSMEWAKEQPEKEEQPSDSSEQKITLKSIDKSEYDKIIKQLKGQVVLVDFWATWCIPCRKSFPHTVELSEKYAEQGLVVVSVACDDPDAEEQVKKFLTDKQAGRMMNYRASSGAEEETFSTYQIGETGLPHYKVYGKTGDLLKTFFIDEEGTPIDLQELEETLKSEL